MNGWGIFGWPMEEIMSRSSLGIGDLVDGHIEVMDTMQTRDEPRVITSGISPR